MELRQQLLVYGALIVVLSLMLGTSPARAGVTIYDISILLYQPHPWIDDSLPDEAADTGPPTGVRRAVGYAARRRVDGVEVPPDRFGDRAGQPAAGDVGYQAAAYGAPEHQNLSGPYSFFVYGGVATKEVLAHFYKFDTTDTQLLAVGMTARLHRFEFGLELEGEVGVARRFGQDDLWEVWVAAGVRWRDFPWNHIVNTTFGLALLGIDYTTKVPPHEIEFQDNEKARLLYFLAPELTFALPEYREVALMLRIHHRSDVDGLFQKGAANFISAGLRFQY